MQFNWTQFNPAKSARPTIPGLGFYRYAVRQPNWITRAAFTVFALVIAIPILLLFFLALLAAAAVFGVLALVNALTASFRRGIGGSKANSGAGRGRQNVKILPRKE